MKAGFLLALALALPADVQPVTVEIVTVGHATVPAGRYLYGGAIVSSGDNRQMAEAAFNRSKQKLIAAVTAAGGKVVVSETKFEELYLGDNVIDLNITDANEMSAPADTDAGAMQASATLAIEAPDRAAAGRIRAAIASIDGVSMNDEGDTLPLDPLAARRAAKADGLVNARAEAAAYAAKLGLPTVTLTAISEKADIGAILTMSDSKGPPLGPWRRSTGDTIIVDVPLTVTFRLEPAAKP